MGIAEARAAFVRVYMKNLKELLPGSKNIKFYKNYFEGLTDVEFETMVDQIETGQHILPVYVPNLSEERVEVQHLLDVADNWDHAFFQHLERTDQKDPTITYTTPKKYLVLELPFRRQAQTLETKVSVPQHNRQIDDLTGQVTGASKGSALSAPELQVLFSEDLDDVIAEFINPRGGDRAGYQQLEYKLINDGEASIDDAKAAGGRAKTTITLSTLLNGAMLENNL